MWKKEDVDLMLDLLTGGKSYKEISLIVNKTEGSIRSKSHKLGYKSSTYYNSKKSKFQCKECNIEFEDLIERGRVFCSQSCNAKFNNRKRKYKYKSKCIFCNKEIKSKKYCSKECQFNNDRNIIFDKIENGDTSLYEKNYKKYLIHKHGESCMECGWSERNKKTGKVPIQLEHIDGHSENNKLDNLKLLCPNCHSLTETFGALNKGNGRKNRKR